MVDWQITATMVYCDVVDANVIILVHRDWSTKCTGYEMYSKGVTKHTAKTVEEKRRKLGRELRCEGSGCARVNAYKDKLFAEEDAETR